MGDERIAGVSETFCGTEITCQQFIEFLLDYLAGELSPREQAIFAAHLSICPDCVNYLESYQHTLLLQRQVLRSEIGNQQLPPDAPPLPEDLVRADPRSASPRITRAVRLGAGST